MGWITYLSVSFSYLQAGAVIWKWRIEEATYNVHYRLSDIFLQRCVCMFTICGCVTNLQEEEDNNEIQYF